ncbi:fimbria/pilus periplasmic chaperone, partial [Salmonella enterica]
SSRQQLATDRESLFWLNIYQIPPLPHDIKNHPRKLVLPLRLRLKILIRPTGLKAPTEAEEKKLRFIAKENTIRIVNPTSWYMSLTLTTDNKKSIGDIMVAPKTALDVPLTR